MRSMLGASNVGIAETIDSADVVVINTCTVKSATEQKTLYLIDNLARKGKKLVLTGCMAGANRRTLEKHAPEASIVSPSNIGSICDAVESAYSKKKIVMDSYKKTDKLDGFAAQNSIIARIPVSEGCENFCSFCETKFARGPLNSFSEELILKAIERSIVGGAREIQLTSQDMGAYGMDRGTNTARLMERVAEIKGDFKVRVGMLNPDHLWRYIDELIEALQSEKFYKFLHLPIQSGSDPVIRHMGRRCTEQMFESYVKELRKKIRGVSIETDLIVGYPTETDDDFKSTLDFVERVKPDMTNISRFGTREHARASMLKQLKTDVVNERSKALSRKVREVQNGINSELVGSSVDALITEQTSHSTNGRTGSYKQTVLQNACGIGMGDSIRLSVYAASANALYCNV